MTLREKIAKWNKEFKSHEREMREAGVPEYLIRDSRGRFLEFYIRRYGSNKNTYNMPYPSK